MTRRRTRQLERAFTITELLVVVGIIALLAGIIFVSFKGLSTSAQQTRSANSLRDIIRGYLTYCTDNNQRLMPGYIAPGDLAVNGGPVDVEASNLGGSLLNDVDTGAYVWRLLPYLNNDLKALTMDYSSKRFDAVISSEVDSGVYGPGTRGATGYGIGFVPSFGLNSIYLGGDSVHGPAAGDAPWLSDTPVAATRLSEVRNTAETIAFAPTYMVDQNATTNLGTLSVREITLPNTSPPQPGFGSAELRPPYVGNIPQWTHIGGSKVANAVGGFANFGGVPIARRDNFIVPNARLDGSISLDDIGTLGPPDGEEGNANVRTLFMRRWNPFATGVVN